MLKCLVENSNPMVADLLWQQLLIIMPDGRLERVFEIKEAELVISDDLSLPSDPSYSFDRSYLFLLEDGDCVNTDFAEQAPCNVVFANVDCLEASCGLTILVQLLVCTICHTKKDQDCVPWLQRLAPSLFER